MSDEHDVIRVNWVVAETAVPETVSTIQESGGAVVRDPSPFVPPPDEHEDYDDAQFDPLLIIPSAVAIGYLVKRISDVWLDHKRPVGQIVDARGPELVIRPGPLLPRGTLLVMTDAGSEVYQLQNKDDALLTLSKLTKQFL